MKKQILSILILMALIKINAQTTNFALVNKVSEVITGSTDTANLAPLTKAAPNLYVVSTNKKINSTQNDMQTTCINNNVLKL